MGASRLPTTSDATYNRYRTRYLKDRPKLLFNAKVKYQQDRPAMLAIMKAARDAAREVRLQAKREAFYAANPLKVQRGTNGASLEYGKAREFVRNFKAGKPCLDCGQTYPHYIMEFDHIGNDKHRNVSDCVTIASAEREIVKCELVCANCHRERTFHRFPHL